MDTDAETEHVREGWNEPVGKKVMSCGNLLTRLSYFWKQRNWHLISCALSNTCSLGGVGDGWSLVHSNCRNKSVKYTKEQTSESYVLRYLHALRLNTEYLCVVIQVVFVSVKTDLTDLIKPTYYYSSFVWVCHWVQALLSRKSSMCPIRAPYNHEDSLEKRDMFADCDRCWNHPWEPPNYPNNPWD
jgi:hypothetical protein